MCEHIENAHKVYVKLTKQKKMSISIYMLGVKVSMRFSYIKNKKRTQMK